MQIQMAGGDIGARFSNASLVGGSGLTFATGFDVGYTLNPFDPATDLLQEEVTKRMYRRIVDGSLSFEFGKKPLLLGSLDATVFPLCMTHWANYFHFLIESLPDLLHFLDNGMLGPDAVVVTGQMHPNMADAMSVVMGDNLLATLQLNPFQQVDCKDIIAGPGAAHGIERIDGTLSKYTFRPDVLIALRDRFREFWASPSEYTGGKLFVIRHSYMRHLVNSAELEDLAVKAGYVVVRPEKLNLIQQIRLFSSASRIIGPTGAWLANMLFTREDAVVTVLLPETCRAEDPIWPGLGNALGVTVRESYLPIVKPHESQPQHSDFSCPAEVFRALL